MLLCQWIWLFCVCKLFGYQFAICWGVVVILLLNVMLVFSVVGGTLLDRPCMVFQRVSIVHVILVCV